MSIHILDFIGRIEGRNYRLVCRCGYTEDTLDAQDAFEAFRDHASVGGLLNIVRIQNPPAVTCAYTKTIDDGTVIKCNHPAGHGTIHAGCGWDANGSWVATGWEAK